MKPGGHQRKSQVLRAFNAGMTSGAISTVLFQPFELVKTRMQKAHAVSDGHPSMSRIVVSVVKSDGVRALWTGLTPALLRAIPGIGMYFGLMQSMKSVLTKDVRPMTSLEAGVVGAASRFIAGSILMPVTVLKTRYESGLFPYSGVREALVTIVSREGSSKLFAGLVPTMVRDLPFAALYLAFYTNAQSWMQSDEFAGKVSLTMIHATYAAVMASMITHPPDVLRTRMQLSRNRMQLSVAATEIYSDSGLVGFFRGLVPRLMRRTLLSCVSWTVYEQTMKK